MKFLLWISILCLTVNLYAQDLYIYKLFNERFQAPFPATPEVSDLGLGVILYHYTDKKNDITFVSITDTKKRLEIAKEISPITWVTPDNPPVIIIHGDKDFLVPKQQSESIIEKFKEAHVPEKLIIKEGGSHGWPDREVEEKNFVEWFDKYLK